MIISFSLWGSNPRYHRGAIQNACIANNIYSGWRCRFYCSPGVPADVIKALQDAGAETIIMPGDDGLFWRFLPAGDSSIKLFISRDTDSLLNVREKAAVDEWIASGKDFHIMRDHYYHHMPMMGGLWGCKGGAIPDIAAKISAWSPRSNYNDDQLFLAKMVWPYIQDRCICHDSCPTHKYEGVRFDNTRPFPPHQPYTSFVGEVVVS